MSNEENAESEKCIYTKFREVDKNCLCDNTCQYHIDSKENHNCCLEVANQGEHTLKQVAKTIGYTACAVMHIENRALKKLSKKMKQLDIDTNE